MGFDLHGIDPVTKEGEYFRNNCWWWRPLWQYVCANCKDILTPKQIQSGEYNDGVLIEEEQCIKIADRLDALVKKGKTEAYAKDYVKFQKELPDEPCDICKGKGIRNDNFVKGKCNACDGTGKKRPWVCSYPFSVENVKEFSEFIRDSGGFEIW